MDAKKILTPVQIEEVVKWMDEYEYLKTLDVDANFTNEFFNRYHNYQKTKKGIVGKTVTIMLAGDEVNVKVLDKIKSGHGEIYLVELPSGNARTIAPHDIQRILK